MKLYLRALVFGALVALLNPVWALRAPIVPIPGYEILEYLESSGEQYIDTGIVYASDTKLEQRFCFSGTPGKMEQMGALDSVSGIYHRFHWGVADGATLRYLKWVGSGFETTVYPDADGWVNVTLDAALTQFTESGHSTISLFARKNEGAYKCGNFRVGQTCIWKGGVLVRNMVPVRRKSDNVLGLYDYCQSKFYENEGTGEFEAGSAMDFFMITKPIPDILHPIDLPFEAYCPLPEVRDGKGRLLTKDVDYTVEWTDNARYGMGTCTVTGAGDFVNARPLSTTFVIAPKVNLPKEFQQLFYLETTGTVHYIDTDIHPTLNTRIMVLVQMTAKANTQVIGILDTPQWRRFHLAGKWINSSKHYFAGGVGGSESQYTNDDGLVIDAGWNVLTMDTLNKTLSVNGGANYNILATSGNLPTVSTLRIFGRASNDSTYNIGNPVKIAYVGIYECDEKAYEFIPCRRKSDGTLGLYDVVGKQFYVNNGSSEGGFVAGPEVGDVGSNGLVVIVR